MEQQNSNKEELLSNLKKALEIQLGVDEIHKQIDGVKKEISWLIGGIGTFFSCVTILNGLFYLGLAYLVSLFFDNYSSKIVWSITTFLSLVVYYYVYKWQAAERVVLEAKLKEVESLLETDSAKANSQYLDEVVGPKYHDSEAIAIFIDYLENGRSDNLKEAKNIYENEKLTKQNIEAMDRVRSQMVSLQAEIAKGNEKLAKGQSKIVNQIRFK